MAVGRLSTLHLGGVPGPSFERQGFERALEVERSLAEALGQRLYELRRARGLTQEDVAEAAGISRNHYQLLEYGLGQRNDRKPANPRLSTLIALSDVLGTTVPDLIAGMFNGDLEPDGSLRRGDP